MNTREKDKAAAARHGCGAGPQAEAFVDGCEHRDAQIITFLTRQLTIPVDERDNLYMLIVRLHQGEHIK